MRTSKDRIRHTLGFESIGLIIFIPLASQFLGYQLQEMSIMAVAVSIIATVSNGMDSSLPNRHRCAKMVSRLQTI